MLPPMSGGGSSSELRLSFRWRRAVPVALVLAVALPARGFELTGLTPSYAEPGQLVTVTGTGLDPFATTVVRVGGISAGIDQILATSVRFAVPVGAVSGQVTVQQGAAPPVVLGRTLTVLRALSVSIDPALASATSGYLVGGSHGDAPAGPGPWTVRVPAGEAGVVAASGAAGDPALLGFATDANASLVLGAASTAQALVFSSPFAFDADPEEAGVRLASIAALPETAALAALIADAFADGRDWSEDPALDALLLDAGVAFLTTTDSPPIPLLAGAFDLDYVSESLNFAPGSPRDLPEVPGVELLNRLNVVVSGGDATNDERGVPTRGIKWDPTSTEFIFGTRVKGNPLDWLVALYELDPEQFPGGKSQVDALVNNNSVYTRLRRAPEARLIVRATPYSKQIDVIDRLKKLVTSAIFPPSPDLRIAVDRPGLYLARQFSGALYPPQAPLLAALPDGREEAARATAVNVTIAVIDTIGILFKVEDVVGSSKIADIVIKAQMSVTQALARRAADGTLSDEMIQTLYIETAKVIVEQILDEARKAGIRALAGAAAKTLLKLIDLPGKIAKGGAVVERIIALTKVAGAENFSVVQAVETTSVQVSDPFRPRVTSFSPRRGHRGTMVRIEGKRFSANAADMIVEFGVTPGTDPNAPATIPAPILSASPTALLVRVPDVAAPTLANGLVTIVVRRPGRGISSTLELEPPFDAFEVIPDPVILGLDPDPPQVGRPLTFLGSGFAPERARNAVEVTFNGFTSAWTVTSVTPSSVTVRPLVNILPTTARIRIEPEGPGGVARYSNPISFTAEQATGGAGNSFVISTTADGNSPDGDVTLREALGWMSGTLARPPTLRDPMNDPPFPQTRFESDFIPGRDEDGNLLPYGPGLADSLSVYIQLPAGSVAVVSSGPLPPVTSYDYLELSHHDPLQPVPDKAGNLTIDGTGVPGSGLVLAGSGITLWNLNVRGFGGDCVLLDGASNNTIQIVDAQDCGGSGFHLTGEARGNTLHTVNATGNDFHGLHLEGPGVRGNSCEFPLVNSPAVPVQGSTSQNGAFGVRGFGVLVEGGAANNLLNCGHASQNGLGGIRVSGAASTGNFLGNPDHGGPIVAIPYSDVLSNGGPGIWTDASDTRVRYLRVAGNQGDGILLEGTDHTGTAIEHVIVGLDASSAALANQGSGIHLRGSVSDVRIGSVEPYVFNSTPTFRGPFSLVAGNRDHGIWLEGVGVHEIEVRDARIGASGMVRPGTTTVPVAVPNGIHGIALTGGTWGNTIGHAESRFALEIMGHANGAGVYLAGPDTRENRVFGNRIGSAYRAQIWNFGSDATVANRYGIQITDRAHSNQIGVPGERLLDASSSGYEQSSANYIYQSSEAGILIESGGIPDASIAPGQTPEGANVIQNNEIGGFDPRDAVGGTSAPNQVGILLRGDGRMNLIGGTGPGEGNMIAKNTKAGLQIDGIVVTQPNLANRIVGNVFGANFGAADGPDPLNVPPDGVGLLVTNGASGHVIGGDDLAEGNWFAKNRVGVYVHSSSDIALRGNHIGHTALSGGSVINRNFLAGAVLSGCTRCELGPNNEINANGRIYGGLKFGGVVVRGGTDNRIFGNTIGTDPGEATHLGNDPYGVLLSEAPGSVVGDPTHSNVIVASISDGVRLEGAGTVGSQVANNWIGRLRRLNVSVPNGGAGVRLRAGASGNVIGGNRPIQLGGVVQLTPTGNTLLANTGGGIVVDGATTVGNTLTNNSISGHPGLGIDNVALGNHELAPPVITSVSGGRARGTTSGVPDGSLVQVWWDLFDEGIRFIGEGEVTSGAFDVAIRPVGGAGNVNATVTHAGTGDTSEFSVPVPAPEAGFVVELDPDVTVPATAPAGAAGVVVLPLRLRALDATVSVRSLAITASGSLNEPSHVAAITLWRDSDGNGEVSSGDAVLGGPDPLLTDDGTLGFALDGLVIEAGETERWLVGYDLSSSAPAGATFAARIGAPADVVAELAFGSGGPVTPSNAFPVSGPDIDVVGALDTDGDGRSDPTDNCPFRANALQTDADGNGAGDACQCGDVAGPSGPDGLSNALDGRAIREHLVGRTPLPQALLDKCSVIGDADGCNLKDWVVLARAPAPPGPEQICRAAVGP
jgi:hypothetical protein